MERFAESPAPVRPLRIYSSDPMTPQDWITIDVPNEDLRPGPWGSRLRIIDYDGAHDCYYEMVDLDDPNILIQGGLCPNESDPRFHQQNVYAVASRVIANFERALGRQISFARGRQRALRIFPHAFHGANAFFDPRLNALLFGYFTADRNSPGPNLPGQNVFTCLSHDIIAHEMTHAIVHRMRSHFIEPSNRDVLAFHEGFADIVALFQHFSFETVLKEGIQARRTQLHSADGLVSLAQQFGYARGKGAALRSALGHPNDRISDSVVEPHRRGGYLVGAVFDGFFALYRHRIADLLRIATGGTGKLPDGDLHPDLVDRVAAEASSCAQSVLTMCIRAFDYMPPVDVTFGDYLRALITADYELSPEDPDGRRQKMIAGFRNRGILPEGVPSLAEESLILASAPPGLARFDEQILSYLGVAAQSFGPRFSARRAQKSWQRTEYQQRATIDSETSSASKKDIYRWLHAFASANAKALKLSPDFPIQVAGFHPVFRVAPDGLLRIELVTQFLQKDASAERLRGGLPLRGGCTLVTAADGEHRYLVAAPLPSGATHTADKAAARARVDRQATYFADCDARDPRLAWGDRGYMEKRMEMRAQFSALCDGVAW